MAKDRFSEQASDYAKYRPTYPPELFDYLLRFVHGRNCAWDCGTGNGQAAAVLADFFDQVEATDISEAQLKKAAPKPNLRYQVAPAERTPFADNSFDLITVATAYHWLDWNAFFAEATRVGKPDAVVAAWAYNLVQTDDDAVDQVIHRFYFDLMYTYWDPERRHVEQAYHTVAFDFAPLPSKDFFIERHWNRDELLGYIATWSSVQNYQRQHGQSPVAILEKELQQIWPADESKTFRFPLFLKIGRITK